jgi:hypothetical protein
MEPNINGYITFCKQQYGKVTKRKCVVQRVTDALVNGKKVLFEKKNDEIIAYLVTDEFNKLRFTN